MTIGLVRPSAGELRHFSEDPCITVFAPHVAATAREQQPYVWAVDFDQAPAYWFPRDCPRVLTWASASATAVDGERFLGASSRVHAIEYAWLDKLLSTVLYAYRFDKSQFVPFGAAEPHAYVSTATVRPLHPPERVGSLLEAHAAAAIELRVLANLWPYWKQVIRSTLGFSGIRVRNVQPEEATTATLPGQATARQPLRL